MYEVRLTKKAAKGIRSLPKNAQETFWTLVHAIEDTGPVQPRFPNYSKLGNFTYHCHLAYHWVACWRNRLSLTISGKQPMKEAAAAEVANSATGSS